MPLAIPLDLGRLHVRPLAERRSLAAADDILVDPASEPPPLDPVAAARVAVTADRIRTARGRDAQVILM